MNSLLEVVSFLRSEIGEWPECESGEVVHWQFILAWLLDWISENVGLAVNSFDDFRNALLAAYTREREHRLALLSRYKLQDFEVNESTKKSAITGE